METKNEVLEVLETKIVLETEKNYSPKESLKNRKGLWISSGFIERILDKAANVEGAASITVDSYKLMKYADDATIESALPEKHLFNEDEVCVAITALISKQSKGEEGTLLSSGYANLFYTPAFVVDVRWDDGEWRVFTWSRRDGEWYDDRRVFSPAN